MHFSSGGSALTGLSPSGRENMDPIAELLSQLSSVRSRAAAAQSVSSQLQQLEMQLQTTRYSFIIGIKHGFSCINICEVPREVLKTEAGGRSFQHLLRDLANVMHGKTMFDRYYCIKTKNICYISGYFLHYFVLPCHWCLANAISTDYALSRAGQYTSRNCCKSVAPVRSYWKLPSHALTARELPC